MWAKYVAANGMLKFQQLFAIQQKQPQMLVPQLVDYKTRKDFCIPTTRFLYTQYRQNTVFESRLAIANCCG